MIEEVNEAAYPKGYAVKHKDYNVRRYSRSGGVFTALTDQILDNAGVIYGCCLNPGLEVIHKKAASREERDSFRGSKYVQSNLLDTFSEVQSDLENNRSVLFSGTTCQIAALKAFINIELQSKLLLVDIVCHGVPSPKVYHDYLDWVAAKKKGTVSHIDFRNKERYGWAEQIETVKIGKAEYDSKIYTNLFVRNLALRPSCYHCPYKNLSHPSDITIADFWGIEKAVPGFDDNQGVSLVLLNNEKGVKFFEAAADNLEYIRCPLEHCIQPSLLAPVKEPSDRASFWKDYRSKPFAFVVKRYASEPWRTRLRFRLQGKIV